MSSLPTFAAPAIARADHMVRSGYQHAQDAVEQLTHRDRTRAAEAVMACAAEIGDIEYVGRPAFIAPTDTVPASIDQIARIQRGDHTHQLRLTRPLCRQDASGEAYLALPGITLDPSEPGAASFLHEKLVENANGSMVATMNTEFIGKYESHGSLKQIVSLSFKQMAETRLDIGRKLFDTMPVHGIGYSMGAMILGYTAVANLERPEAVKLNFVDLSFIKPALVTPDLAKKVFAAQFLPSYLRKSVAEEGGWLPYAKAFMHDPQLFPKPCIGNAIQLAAGISEESLRDIVQVQRVGLQVGEDDPLAQPSLYDRLRESAPLNFNLKVYAERGHSILDHAAEVIDDLRYFTKFGFYPVAGAMGEAA